MQNSNNYRPAGIYVQQQSCPSTNNKDERSDQHHSEFNAPDQHQQITISNGGRSHHDNHMGANELESSPEVRSQYLENDEGRPSEEPRTASRQPSHSGLHDGDMRNSSAQASSAAMRPVQIDQSSIIKTNDESAFNNNLNIFPNGGQHSQPPTVYSHQQQTSSATFPTVTNFHKDSLE